MARINAEQLEALRNIKVERVSKLDSIHGLLDSIQGTLITLGDGRKVPTDLHEKFINELQSDIDGDLASYLILSPTNIVLQFFSIRCGELFTPKVEDTYNIGKIYNSSKKNIKAVPFVTSYSVPPEKIFWKAIRKTFDIAHNKGYNDKVINYHISSIIDNMSDNHKIINQVHESHPSIEIKYWGSNFSFEAKEYWSSLRLPSIYKMGQILFWHFVVKKIEEVRDLIGSTYVYLFAADQDPDGLLVKYYKEELGFDFSNNIHVNKPYFDWQCRFMLQPITNILAKREEFYNSFNPDENQILV